MCQLLLLTGKQFNFNDRMYRFSLYGLIGMDFFFHVIVLIFHAVLILRSDVSIIEYCAHWYKKYLTQTQIAKISFES